MEPMYVLVRRDLSWKQRSVQAGHALAMYIMTNKKCPWLNGTLVYLGVEDEADLLYWSRKLKKHNILYSIFFESFYNEYTALAVYSHKDMFEDLFLL